MTEKKYITEDLEIELRSYIDYKQNVWSRGRTLLRYLVIVLHADQAIRTETRDV